MGPLQHCGRARFHLLCCDPARRRGSWDGWVGCRALAAAAAKLRRLRRPTMKTQYYTAASLDGFIADQDHSLAWLLQFPHDTGSFGPFIKDVGAVAMGSNTYSWILNEHAAKGTNEQFVWPYEQPTWVFSSRDLERVPGDIRFVRGDV